MLNFKKNRTSTPSRPPSGRPQTSWFRRATRVRIGDIDVLVVSDGVLPLPTTMLGHNADPAARAAWLDRHVPAAGRIRLGAERGRGS